ncbi:hypothetical protein [Williamsia sp. D3]|uniref:hypothetical protein n=1 Tax=Williamsia sp. D3 TaxID=1313067 RepID=UPI000428B23D|nr:hypothetical protein [Williamsia sp. D3]
MGNQSRTDVDTIGLARWGREAALLGEDLAAALDRSGRHIAMCANGFGTSTQTEFVTYVTTLDRRAGEMVGALEGLAAGLAGAAASYGSVDDCAAGTFEQSSTGLRL